MTKKRKTKTAHREFSAPKNRDQGADDGVVFLPGRKALLELERKRPAAIRRVHLKEGLHPSDDLRLSLERLAERGVRAKHTSSEELDRLAPGVNHQGILTEIAPLPPATLREVLERSASRNRLLVALDEVNDPHNLGAILRAADATGADGVILPRDHSSPVTPAVRKVSAGASEFVPIASVPNLARALETCREAGYWIVGTAIGEGSRSIFESDVACPLVLVIGSEGRGLRKLTKDRCDILVHLPMEGEIQSVNASQAASAFLYELLRRRLAARNR